MSRKDLFEFQYSSITFLFLFLIWTHLIRVYATQKPFVRTDAPSIEVGPGPNAVRLKNDETFILNCTIDGVSSYDIVTHVEWTFENELDEIFKIETLDNDDIEYDHVLGKTTYKFDHHPTSADAGVYNCTFFRGSAVLARATIQLTCDPVPKEGARSWRGLKEDDPFRRDYKHVPSYTIYPGDEQTLECRATAYPRPKFKWFRVARGIEDDDLIGTAPRVEIPERSASVPVRDSNSSEEDDDDEDVHVMADGDVLRVRNARFEERGYYCCTANNSDDYSLNLYFLIRVKNPLAVLWPLLGIGIIAVLVTLMIGVGEHLRRRSEAKQERSERLAEKKADPLRNAALSQMTAVGADVKLRPNAKAVRGTKETEQ